MIKIRLRHPKGVTSLDLDPESSIMALSEKIFSATEIPPINQELKVGYPPKSITAIPSLPISSLGLKTGDQLIVIQASNTNAAIKPASATIDATSSRTGVAGRPSVSAPAFEPRTQPRQEMKPKAAEQVNVPDGILVHRVVPDDNSCLFSSIVKQFGVLRTLLRISWNTVIADAIKKDPETYSDAVLGAILLYSGIHYDAVSLAPMEGAPLDFHTTVFPVSNQAIYKGAETMASHLRQNKAFTNTATFTLKCEKCGVGLKGEKEARAHASSTGHAEFGEY
ncbi:ubiquitin-specific protease otu1 [Tulasnella sp. 330]|nr:ubiquitin-specific protease otu1 [Tulasnella sp. 330]